MDIPTIDRVFGMEDGYVLNFTNQTFAEFFRDEFSVNIYDHRWGAQGNSKANRLRCYLRTAGRHAALKALKALWEYREASSVTADYPELEDKVRAAYVRIVQRLGGTEAKPAPSAAAQREQGEQIDGSFVLAEQTYLLEARWRNARVDVETLRAFNGKVEEKASWSRGLIISQSGFTEDGLHAFGRGKRVICMDGLDLHEVLSGRLHLADVITLKARRAAETGMAHVPVRDLNPP